MSEMRPEDAKRRLATELQYVKGVGPKRAPLLEKLGLRTAKDLLFFFPRSYEEIRDVKRIDELVENEPCSICGIIREIDMKTTRNGLQMLGVLVEQDGDFVRGIWFNQNYMRRKLFHDMRVMISGKPRFRGLRWEMSHPKLITLKDDEAPPANNILPVYRLTEGISQHQMRRIVHGAVDEFGMCVDEVFSGELLEELKIWPIQAALAQIHRPIDAIQLKAARHRFVVQELLVLQLALAMRRENLALTQKSPSFKCDALIDARIVRLFPFDLTSAQREAIQEIVADMSRGFPMNRLLQGDVGSGKTVVAIYAALVAVANGYQAAIMAPTEILAQQHYRTLQKFLAHSRVQVDMLTGSLSDRERQAVMWRMSQGASGIVVGTQAVIQENVKFAKLGLVVIDEQHKFGVKQRAMLREAGEDPHYLVMSATPIPRSMTMTVFGDLDVSTLRSGPPTRQKVHTYVGTEEQRAQWWDFFRKKLNEGRQGYVIVPLVESKEDSDWSSVAQIFEELTNGPLAEFRVGFLHGRMKPEEKALAMQNFATGETQVLVSTTVVEVGVDVPNATLMTIESGERFGLSQLHQLRGRVSRGTHAGYVCVFGNVENEDASTRLQAFARTTDGFELAELDFELRGPGDMLGTKQHGMPPLRVADLVTDREIVVAAKEKARELLARSPALSDPRWEKLKRQVLRRYGKVLDLGDVG